MDNKHRAKQPARKANTKASSSFSLADSFENDLLRAAQEQVRKIESDRKNRVNFDKLLASVIDQVLTCTVNLQPSEVAMAANRILGDLVNSDAIKGTLPTEERIQAAVRKHLRTRKNGATDSDVSPPTQVAPRTTLPSIPESPQKADEAHTHSVAWQNHTPL